MPRRIQEVDQHLFVFLQQPDAEQVAGNHFQRRPGQRGQHHRVPLRARLAFEEDGPQLPRVGHRAEGGAVEGFVGFVGVGEDVERQGGRHETEQFMRGEHLLRCEVKGVE